MKSKSNKKNILTEQGRKKLIAVGAKIAQELQISVHTIFYWAYKNQNPTTKPYNKKVIKKYTKLSDNELFNNSTPLG